MDKTNDPLSGADLRAMREALGWSQERLAKEAETDQQTIQRIETGQTKHSRALPRVIAALTHGNTRDSELQQRKIVREALVALAKQITLGGGEKVSQSLIDDLERNWNWEPEDLRKHLVLVFNSIPEFDGHGAMRLSSKPVEVVGRSSWMFGGEKTAAIYVSVSDMVPEFEPGDFALIDYDIPPIPTSTCLFSRDDALVCIRRLTAATPETWHVEQWNPRQASELSREEWPFCSRIIGKIARR